MPTMAGGYLTNTNQSVAFLRNPSQDAMIGISALYNNPAGVTFLPNGFHASLGLFNVAQERNVTSTFAPYAFGAQNGGATSKMFKGKADAPVVPNLQLAYNFKDRWSVNFDFGIVGGGGKCTFDKGLASFESIVAMLPVLAADPNSGLDIKGYDLNSYMRGRNYQFGFQFGAGFKATKNLSVYAGLRLVYATNNYYGYLKNISVMHKNGEMELASPYFNANMQKAKGAAETYANMATEAASTGHMEDAQKYGAMATQYKAAAVQAGTLGVLTQDLDLNCDQTGWGVTPIIGIDWRINKHWNLAAKYEFQTRLVLKNRSGSRETSLPALEQFEDGKKITSNIPATLTLGAQYSPIEAVRINTGFHYYFDKQATAYKYKNRTLNGGTYEITAGVEFDPIKQLTVSAGWQLTNYPNTDAYMNDISFATNSNSIGVGIKWQINKHWGVEAGYFHTFYQKYTRESADNYNNLATLVGGVAGAEAAQKIASIPAKAMIPTAEEGKGMLAGKDVFHRQNRVIGIGATLAF